MATQTHGLENTASGTNGTAPRRRVTETKASFKTTEFFAMLAVIVGVLVAMNKNLTAWHGWLLVSIVAVGYMVSRGLAKSGSYDPYTDKRDDSAYR